MNTELLAAESTVIEYDEHRDLDLEQSLEYLEWLMLWYSKKPSLLIANIIVARLELLKAREETCEISNAGWSCSRLIKIWEYIADENHGAVPV